VKHLTQIQVLGGRTHSRSESERRISRLLVEGAARMEGLSLGLVHGRPPLVGCVRRIALTCGFAFPVQSRTRFPTATDQKVRGSSPFGRTWSEGVRALGLPYWVSMGLDFPWIAADRRELTSRAHSAPQHVPAR